LQQALSQVDDLKRALASSQRESVAAKKQIELLTNANVLLRGLAPQPQKFPPRPLKCPAWGPPDLPLSAGLDPDDMAHIERLLTNRVRFRKGEALYRFGDAFYALYAIRAGSCKTVLLAQDGREQVAGYHIVGEVIGMDGIALNVHECQATALEDMEACPLPFDRLENLARFSDPFRYNLHRLLSQECSRAQTMTLVLGTMRADKRLAVFLLELSQRYRARGFSSSEFMLRMSREEIGSYLGLKLETISRLFSRFHREGLIQIQGRAVKLIDEIAVRRLIDSSS
jgi:CRP/FNR family transcriptional regulator